MLVWFLLLLLLRLWMILLYVYANTSDISHCVNQKVSVVVVQCCFVFFCFLFFCCCIVVDDIVACVYTWCIYQTFYQVLQLLVLM